MGVHRLARISYRYPKVILLFWTLVLLFFGFYANKLPTVLQDHGLLPNGAFTQVQHLLSADFHIPEDPIVLVFEKKELVSLEQFQHFIELSLFQLHGIDGLTKIVSPLQTQGMLKGNYAYALLVSTYKPHEMKPVLDNIQRRLLNHNDMSVKMTGKSVVQADVNRASERDLRQVELIGIPIAFMILWFAFRGIVSAIIPIVIGMIAVASTMGMMYWIGTKIELSNFVLNVIPMVGLALSIDFSLILVSRFREELKRQAAEHALVAAMKTAGKAVLFSASSVFLGLMGTLLIPLPIFTSVAVGAMTVLAVSVSLAFTLLPAILSFLWPAIQSEHKTLPLSALSANRKTSIWYRMSLFVMNKPVRMLLLASLLLIGCFLPLSRLKLAIPDASSLPPIYKSRQAAEAFQTQFVNPSTSPIVIVLQGKSLALNNSERMKAYAFIQRLEHDPGVVRVDSIYSTLGMQPGQLEAWLQQSMPEGKYESVLQRFINKNHMLLYVTLRGSPSSDQTMDWLRHWEQAATSADLPYVLGGEAKYQQEVFDAIFQHIGYVLLFILLSNYWVLFFAFRSLLIPLKTLVMNLLSLGASFGILVWIFEEGNMGMEPSRIAIMIPVFIFGLTFGISMDYGVFLVSRIYEAYQRTQDNDQAVLIGLASTSRTIVSAAAIMIVVTGPFAFAEVVGVQQLGIGIAAAIFIDATIIRMIVVPSLMKLLGRWNWWSPRWLK
ncbi:putative drug exporter of the RND superfamily [Paenibacillus sp. 1_12]|uniref:MMPL family transporter n=1 Tax=Paenibacillus sp. 1_12 TaxID=1566278 RepID=UPI0008EB19DC|nr:MMPL family transporter [Paenibacillus sp. 1_12]SFK97674.1 putative drug exporter of the RND superfamily [Paenibacillus sp. 1_12]